MGFLRKSKRAKGLEALRQDVALMGSQQMMIAKSMYEAKVTAEVATADKLLKCAQPKLEEDIRAHYARQIARIKADMEKQANEQIESIRKQAEEHYSREANAYERKARLDYDKHMRQPKAALRREVIGDLMCMTAWVLRDHFEATPEDLHRYVLEMIRLEAMMNDSQQDDSQLERITINDLAAQMRAEGYDMADDIVLIEEMVSAEQERFSREYVLKGSIMDKWTEDEDKRLRRLIVEQERDYAEIALVLGRTESACKARVRKLWGTSVLARVRGEAA